MAADPVGTMTRIIRLAQAFTPAAPVGHAALFTGRNNQIMECISALYQPGLHIAVYGERGVGKTSMANILPEIVQAAQSPDLKAIRVDCNTGDTFRSLWRKIFRDLGDAWNDAEDGDLEPDGVRYRLARDSTIRLIVVDELDRLEDDEALSLLADTLKTLADHLVEATVMLVGVGRSIEELVGEHASVVRSIAQVQMPRMNKDELVTILDRGFRQAEMALDAEAREVIVNMAEGLPHFVHLLGLHSGQIAAENDEDGVSVSHVEKAMTKATQTHVVLHEYHVATRSSQPGHLFEEVLLACAFAPKDELGFFRAADVVEPLSKILNRATTIPSFARHLNSLAGATRGYTLQKHGEPHNFQYRFGNPLLEPFAKMVGASKGKLPEALVREMGHAQAGGASFSTTGLIESKPPLLPPRDAPQS